MHWTKCNPKGQVPKTGVRSHSASVVDNKIYILGGYDAHDVYNDLTVFDTEIQYWYKPITSEGPGPVRAHTSTVVGNKIFIFGGGDGPSYFKDVWVLDTDTNGWTQLDVNGSIPCARRSHSAELVENKLYVFGGGDGKQALNDTYYLDVETAAWVKVNARGTPPPKRGYHKSVLVGKNMYIIGGSDGQEAFSDVYMFDTSSHMWNKSRAKGAGLLASATILLGNYIALFGGHSPTEYINSFRCLDLRTTQWTTPIQSGSRPSPRAYHTMSLSNHRMWVIGGYDTVQCYSDVHMLDLGSYASQEYVGT